MLKKKKTINVSIRAQSSFLCGGFSRRVNTNSTFSAICLQSRFLYCKGEGY